MTLPGGPADKLGNRYETWWTVSALVRMLRGDADALRIEEPGVEKAEFVVTAGARRELHQAKRSHRCGKWSLAALASDGLLQKIGDALTGNDDRFVFVSGSDARELADMCEAARDAESAPEFERAFLVSRTRKASFKTLCDHWGRCDVSAVLDRLRRIEVRTIDERGLEEQTRRGIQALFLADPGRVLSELRAIVSDSVHRTITGEALIEKLAGRGCRRRRLSSPGQARAAVRDATDRYLDAARRRLIRGTLVSRPAAETLLSRLGATATESVLTGKAGAGKTACVVEVAEALRERGSPVLAFRFDHVLSASSAADVGRRLELEESPVLALAAAAEAAGRPGVLIVDQVDAVSAMSGRSSGAFDVVAELLNEARGVRPRVAVHTVVVCREFDWKNDHRLRRLVPEDAQVQVDVAEFTADDVKTILDDAGFDSNRFRKRQLKLLRLPQNLSLFLEAGFNASRTPAFGTAKDLFDKYWDEKRRLVEERVAPSPDQWMEVVTTLCDAMTSEQQLSVPKERLDAFSPAYVERLASEGVIVFAGRRCGFGHESFFDYCFARVFVHRPESLTAFIKGSEQHLFRRAQVRQVLAYLRDADPGRYVRELRGLLADEAIRPHLKDLALALLAGVDDPRDEEWTIWEPLLQPAIEAIAAGEPNPDKLSALAWRRFSWPSPWFDVADRRLIQGWLASDNDRLIDEAVNYLRLHQSHAPDRVAELLEPHADAGGEWASRLRWVVSWAKHHTSRRFFELALRLVGNGVLDEARGPVASNSTFWDMFHDLDENRPEWAPELVAGRIRRRFTVIRAAGGNLRGRKLLDDGHSSGRMVKMLGTSAKCAPAAVVEHLLSVVLDVSDSTLIGEEPPKLDAVWPILFRSADPSGENACLDGLARSLAALAREGSADLGDVIADLRRRDTHVANHLLLALYAGGPARYADDAVSLLCDEPWRFKCGFSDSPRWCAMKTIEAVGPQCAPENRKRLEETILRYVPPYERSEQGYKSYGRARFDLLSAIPAELRSDRTRRRFEELKRKFGEPTSEPREIAFKEVRSPIEKAAAGRMTDDQWMGAVRKHRSEDGVRSWREPLRGGAWQLSGVLEECVKEEPERFAQLALRFPADAHPLYLSRALAALKEAKIASALKLQVCRKAFAESVESCGSSIAGVLGGIEDPLPDDAVRMLHQLATEHEDPFREAWREDAGGGQPYYGGDMYFNGVNTTRGRAAEAMGKLILADSAYVDRFRPTLEKMVHDSSAAVRSCVAGTLRAVARSDAARGASLFLRMDLSEDRLLATRHVYEFIRVALHADFSELRPIVERMLRSSEPDVCKAGARLASIAALSHESAAALVDEALRGGAPQRLGVAQVAAANLDVPQGRAWSEATLLKLFDDDDAEVRHEAASCFRQLPDETLDTYEGLIAAFCDSRAFQEDSFPLLYALKESRRRLPGTTCLVCEKFLDRFAGEARDIRTGRYADAHYVPPLVFRTYQQHLNDEWTSRALDLTDRLCLERIGGAEDEFENYER